MNLVVVSNRITRGKANEPMTGGLAAALLPVVEKSGAIWVGSSGRVRDGSQKEPFVEIEALGTGAVAMLDLPAAHYGGFYEGFANSALWPALHSRSDLIRVSQDDYLSYREVNAFMARALLRFRKPDTAFWIQDYHFLALGADLRGRGVTQPIGFFLHTPWPSRDIIGGVPHHRELIEAMLAYDLIGFQTQDDRDNFLGYLAAELAQLRAEREEVIVLHPEHRVGFAELEQRPRHEGVDFAVGQVVTVRNADQVAAGVQGGPQRRVGKTLVEAAVMRGRQIQHRHCAGAERFDLDKGFLLGTVTDPTAGADPNCTGFLHHRQQRRSESTGHRLVRLAARDAI